MLPHTNYMTIRSLSRSGSRVTVEDFDDMLLNLFLCLCGMAIFLGILVTILTFATTHSCKKGHYVSGVIHCKYGTHATDRYEWVCECGDGRMAR